MITYSMTVEIDPRTALKILSKRQARAGKFRIRIHADAMADTADRIRALKGICGKCTSLSLRQTEDYLGRPTVELKCRAKYSPLRLSSNTDLGQVLVCPGFLRILKSLDNK